MDLQLRDKLFIVSGAGSGFGRAIARQLAQEGACILAISRTKEKLTILRKEFPGQIDVLTGDITLEEVQDKVLAGIGSRELSGVLINAGGPPAGGFQDISMNQWDEAWRTVVRWKISFLNKLLPLFKQHNYGRILFIESVSVKQPVQNLILSNALRPSVVGLAKTISREVAPIGITVNVLAPGYHLTAAMERLFRKRSEFEHITVDEARARFDSEIPVGDMGKPEEIATLAVWLLSPLSRYVTGQTIAHEGGIIQGIFG